MRPALGPAARARVAGNSRIRTLNLSSNNIGDKGATLLAEMLKVPAAARPRQAPACYLPGCAQPAVYTASLWSVRDS
jgi:hypothetical protein